MAAKMVSKPLTRHTSWKGWILKSKKVTVTTCKFRFLVFFLVTSLLYFSYPAWLVAIATVLVHEENLKPADALLMENFGTDYLVFEAAEKLLRSGYSSRALVPVQPTSVEEGFVEVMTQIAGIDEYEFVPVRHVEPISLNVALQIADFLEAKGIRSVIVVSPQFRSARSYMVYDHVLTPRGVRVQCLAVPAPSGVDPWWHTWHGLQGVCLEFSKLLYYRSWVL